MSRLIYLCQSMALLTIVPIALSGAEKAREYCAFEVLVKSSRDVPVAGVAVSLLGESQIVFASVVSDQDGVARICDAPPGLVTIKVGGNLCGTATVGYLQRYWMTTRRVVVAYENCSADGWAPLGGCMLTLRVVSEGGNPILGAVIRGDDGRATSRDQTLVSDQFGRILRFLRFGESMAASIHKNGFLTQSITDRCERGNPRDIDVVVTMKPTTSR